MEDSQKSTHPACYRGIVNNKKTTEHILKHLLVL